MVGSAVHFGHLSVTRVLQSSSSTRRTVQGFNFAPNVSEMPVQCHYAVLGVDQDVDDDMLRRAYRKLALQVTSVPSGEPHDLS